VISAIGQLHDHDNGGYKRRRKGAVADHTAYAILKSAHGDHGLDRRDDVARARGHLDELAREVISMMSCPQLTGAALSNQGESVLLFRDGGEPVTPVIGWQDTEVADVLTRLETSAEGERVAGDTGLPLHAMFSAPKLARELAALDHPADVASARSIPG
jgi:sugar (pentulose or hexulose) kinase